MAQLKKSGRVVLEGSTSVYTATLKDPSGTVIPNSSIQQLKLVLYNQRTGVVINSRGSLSGGVYSMQDVHNANNCTFHATSGLFTWNMQPADNEIVDETLAVGESETHVSVFKFQYTVGSDVHVGYHTEVFEVEQVRVI